jgi:peptidyl-prolyl cis-trans isomerase A (cyclophilin A)
MKRTAAALCALVLASGVVLAQDVKDEKILSLEPKKESKAPPAPPKAVLEDPAALKERAPEVFKVRFETTKGDFVVEAHRAWSPNGVDRFYTLVKNGYYDGVKFFRVVPNFVVQFGIHGDPKIATKWLRSNIQDDPVVEGNKKGTLTYAKSGSPNSRSVQLFINLKDNSPLDDQGFAAFGRVIEGMEVVEALYGGYGDKLTNLQTEIAAKGNEFLQLNFPNLDSIERAYLEK